MNEICTDLCAGRRIKLQFQGVTGRRNGRARRIHNRLVEDDRLASRQTLAEARRRLNTMLFAGGLPPIRWFFAPIEWISLGGRALMQI